ncbi:tetratricopeptide repeat protein [Wenzhouxiangella sp. EGI_FJ10305]|uniref:tetratricopeptide repeat protein n=1 Tax=Wenzhouxiangella sp. EGI_FJ10305 TaxID=3243768 RepID=UPI0035DB3B52
MSDPIFLFVAVSAVLLALAFVVVPLLGGRHRAMIATLIVVVPAATLAVYTLVGTPAAIKPDTGETGQIRSAVTDMARQAMREPENSEHWTRLGLAYKRLEEFGSAEHAFRRALYIDNDADFLRAELGETLLYASGEAQLPDEARHLLETAAEGDSQKALWLLGLDAFQREAWPAAIDRFEHLLSVLPSESSVRGTVEQYLAAARSGGPEAESATGDATDDGPALVLSVGIDEQLAGRLEGNETVFVAVRRSSGGPPLAVRRLRADQLPVELTIDDGDAMIEGSGLSSAETVVVTARVSFSGDAMPSEGDFEGQSDVLPIDSETIPAEIIIDQVR